MLATVLPGLRYIRTPLTVGYMWFLVLWIALSHRIASPGQASGGLADIYRLSHAIGPAGTAVAVSVAAYVVGILLVPLSFRIIDVSGTTLRRTFAGDLTPGHRRYATVQSALWDTVAERLSARFCSDEAFRSAVLDAAVALPSDGSTLPRDRPALERLARSNGYARYQLIVETVDLSPLTDDIHNELSYIARRLHGQDNDIYQEYDRLQAEADFRLAIFFPIALFFGVLAIRWQPLWWIGTAAAFALLYVGVASRIEAEQMLATGMAAGRIDDPKLQRVDVAAVSFLQPAANANDTVSISPQSPTAVPKTARPDTDG